MANDDATPHKSNARRTGRRNSGARPASPARPKDEAPEMPAEKALNVKIDGDVAERAMNAFYSANLHARWRDYIQAAVAEYTARLEDEHNHGKRFPPRPAEKLPRGRKVGISPAKRS